MMGIKKITALVKGENDLIAEIILQDVETAEATIFSNVRTATFDVVAKKKYVMSFNIVGTSGQKYKIEITGATKATYPEDEQTSEGRGFLFARITG